MLVAVMVAVMVAGAPMGVYDDDVIDLMETGNQAPPCVEWAATVARNAGLVSDLRVDEVEYQRQLVLLERVCERMVGQLQ